MFSPRFMPTSVEVRDGLFGVVPSTKLGRLKQNMPGPHLHTKKIQK